VFIYSLSGCGLEAVDAPSTSSGPQAGDDEHLLRHLIIWASSIARIDSRPSGYGSSAATLAGRRGWYRLPPV
jgi:hypothetical protein